MLVSGDSDHWGSVLFVPWEREERRREEEGADKLQRRILDRFAEGTDYFDGDLGGASNSQSAQLHIRRVWKYLVIKRVGE